MVYLPINSFVASEISYVSFIWFYFSYLLCSHYYSPELNVLKYMSYVMWDCWIMRLWFSAPHSLSYSCCCAPSLQPVRFPSFCCSYLPHRTAAFTAPHNIILDSTYIQDFKRAQADILMNCHQTFAFDKNKKHYLFALVLWAPTPPNIWCSECRK